MVAQPCPLLEGLAERLDCRNNQGKRHAVWRAELDSDCRVGPPRRSAPDAAYALS